MQIKFFSVTTFIAIIFSLILGLIRIYDPEVTEVARLKYFDFLQRFEPRKTDGYTYTVIIDIDEKSIKEIGQWPWPRTTLARLFDKVNEAGMIALGLDILFSEKDRTSPSMIAKNLQNTYPKIANELLKIPDNEDIASKAMSKIPIVIGHSALNIPGDKNRKDLKESSVKVFIGGDPKKKGLPKYKGILANVHEFEQNAKGAGTISLAKEPDGIIRRVPIISNIAGEIRPTLALEMIRVAFQGNSIATKSTKNDLEEILIQTKLLGKTSIPIDNEGRVWIHYGPSDSRNIKSRYYVSASDVLNGKIGKKRLQGKLGLLGTSATGLKDLKPTSIDERMPGVEIHANLIDTIISAILYDSSKKQLKDVYKKKIMDGLSKKEALKELKKIKIKGSPFLSSSKLIKISEVILTILLSLILIFLGSRFGPVLNVSFFIFISIISFFISYKLYIEKQTFFDPIYPTLSSFIVYFSITFLNYLKSIKEKKQIRGAFKQYLSPDLVEQLASDPQKLKLGGESKKMTFLFCDIRGFTTISESFKSNPQGLTKLINRFLTPLTDDIIFLKGTIDKYMGDCIMAFWNAPLNIENHEEVACQAALRMHKSLKKINKEISDESIRENKKFLELKIGIGINTGNCVVGNMGSEQRFDYSVLGDSVNLASRLEGQSKDYGVKTIIGHKTYENIKRNFATLKLDIIKVKGKSDSVSIYALIGDKNTKESDVFKNLEFHHLNILKLYFNKEWKKILEKINESEYYMDGIMKNYYSLLIKRVNEYITNPPPSNWDGVYVAKKK